MISIVISAFDNALYIEECLNSVIDSCEGIDCEILVGIDNCKKTLDYISKIKKTLSSKIKIFFFKKNVGTYIVRNSLVNISKFNNILFFDSDDVMRKVLVSEVIKNLEEYDLVQYGYKIFHGDLKHSTTDNFFDKPTIPHVGSFGIKKETFLSTNGFEPWICAADGEFLNRIRGNNKKIKFLNFIGLFYRKHNNNLTLDAVTGMNSPLRKFYHRLREEKIKDNNFKPLKNLEIYDFVEYTNNYEEIIKYYEIKTQKENISKTPKQLTIIIPTYDNVEYLDDCLKSIINSIKDLDCEIFIGIDSCQNTINYIRNKTFDNRILFRFFDKKVGPYVIRNSLVNFSNSENILFFDSDDIMLENFIPDVLYNLNKSVIYKPMYSDFRYPKDLDNFDLKKTNKYGEGVFAIKKNVFLSVNGFEPWLCAADSDFMSRIYSRKVALTASRDVVFLRRVHSKSLTVNPETNYSSKLRGHYYGLSKRKRPNGVCSSFVISESKLLDITIQKPESLIRFEEQKNKVDEVINKLSLNSKPINDNIDYNKINQITEKKGVYNPKSSIKPPRQNVPNKRQELIELKKGSMREQVNKSLPGKPNRRNNLPNIF